MLSPADFCYHTLLIGDDTRHLSYCLLLLSKVDVDEDTFRDRTATYDFEDTVDAMARYPEITGGDVQDDRFPEWDEFQALAADYGVTMSG